MQRALAGTLDEDGSGWDGVNRSIALTLLGVAAAMNDVETMYMVLESAQHYAFEYRCPNRANHLRLLGDSLAKLLPMVEPYLSRQQSGVQISGTARCSVLRWPVR